MIERYKGETPDNVVGLDEHKKRPFYKKVSFWVLSVLGLFTGSCSVYGLVLGSQYVRAVTEAAHIIADANSSNEEEQSQSLKKHKSFAINDTYQVNRVNLGALEWWMQVDYFFSSEVLDLIPVASTSTCPDLVCAQYNASTYVNISNRTVDDVIGCYGVQHRFCVRDTTYNSAAAFKAAMSGVFVYYRADGGISAYDDAYDTGYDDGRADGYDAAKEELANPTTIHLSVAAEYYPQTGTFHYEWFVDGEVRQTGDLAYLGSNGWQSVDLYRNPGSTARLVFERTGTQFICEYSTTAFGNDGGYPALNDTNAYDFDDVIWYVPSYYEKFYIRAQGGSAPIDHYSDMYDIFLDPAHNDRAHIGLWDEGYRQGYAEGIEDNGRWQSGWNTGYKTGKEEGYTNGYQKGVSDTQSGSKALMNMFVTAFQQPFNQVYRFLNFNLLGINVLSLFTALLTLSVGIIIIKKVL